MPASPAVYDCNAVNRGVYIADNLDFLRSLNDACIDLVCIDPPFDKNETFVADQLRPPLTEVERQNELRLLAQWGIATPEAAADAGLQWPVDHRVRGGYKDIWRWDTDIHEEWVKSLEAYYPAVHGLIEITRLTHSDGRAAYLCFMAIRLLEIHRVLKPTGSLYLHCDHAANSYLRQLLDIVFGNGENGSPGFRNEITWNRTRGRSDGRHWGNVTDTILFYSKSSEYQWRNIYLPVEQGQDTTGDLTAASVVWHGESGAPWRGINPSDIGRHWAPPRSGNFAQWVEDNRIPGYTRIKSVHDRLDALDEAGLIRWSNTGRPSLLRPAESAVGVKVNNLWADIGRAGRTERTNYPTQKPVALAERIITASTNEGDIVLDCFAGCAYVATAAERTNRRWVACDLNPRAWTVFKRQFNKPNLALLTCNDEPAPGQGVLDGSYAQVFGPHELPTPEHITRPTELAPLPTPERRFRPPQSQTRNDRPGNADRTAADQRLHGLVLRLRQSPHGRDGYPANLELPSGSHRPGVRRRHQRNHQPRPDVSAPQHPQKQPSGGPQRIPQPNPGRRRNANAARPAGGLGRSPPQSVASLCPLRPELLVLKSLLNLTPPPIVPLQS